MQKWASRGEGSGARQRRQRGDENENEDGAGTKTKEAMVEEEEGEGAVPCPVLGAKRTHQGGLRMAEKCAWELPRARVSGGTFAWEAERGVEL